ncbi:hypothetical protein QR685DRAFT_430796, partial [Neurospora intermedia]
IIISIIEAEFTNLVPITKAHNWVNNILDNLNANLGFYKINRILYMNSSNIKDRILNPNLQTKNQYINIQYK